MKGVVLPLTLAVQALTSMAMIALAGVMVPPLVLYLSWRWSAAVVALLCLSLALLTQPARAGSEYAG